jgi:RNA polymerase-binding protein DksA
MVARKTAAKRNSVTGETPTRKAGAAKRAPAEKATGKRAAAKAPPKRAAAKKSALEKPTAKKTTSKETAKKAAPKKAAAKKTAPKKTAPTNAPARKTAGTAPATKKPVRKTSAKKTGAQKVAAKKTPAARATAVPTARSAQSTPVKPDELPVRPGEDPWTEEEVDAARVSLGDEAQQLRGEIDASEQALTGLLRDSGDTAGDDDADTGSKNITREHEMSLAANARERLYQTERALERIEAGTYGLCENCGNPIGKARMQAFPRATLCVECKQKQERR